MLKRGTRQLLAVGKWHRQLVKSGPDKGKPLFSSEHRKLMSRIIKSYRKGSGHELARKWSKMGVRRLTSDYEASQGR